MHLDNFVAEYVAVTKFCLENGSGHLIKNGGYLAAERPVIEELLDRNKFEESAVKLTIWKRLRWIDGDERHVTRNVYIKEEGRRRRMVLIDLEVYNTLTTLKTM
ncbi:MAG: hypothetical protein FWG94_08115 [Oscillospiraceae bacterium]|nr:hypothetical protein [Oscillospiraceae bacterium]